jgi:hypothetical protein
VHERYITPAVVEMPIVKRVHNSALVTHIHFILIDPVVASNSLNNVDLIILLTIAYIFYRSDRGI